MGIVTNRVLKMTPQSPDYARYFPAFTELDRWGVGVTASGFTRIASGSSYPSPALHPEGHLFDWKHGRILGGLQIVLIVSGSGLLETHATGLRRVGSGMAFVLLPHTWHRYRPEPGTGWEESWIELQGPVVDALVSSGVFPPSSILREKTMTLGLHEILDSIHRQSRRWTGGFIAQSSGAGLQALAACTAGSRERYPSTVCGAVARAEKYLSDHHAESISIEELAGRLGVAYSHFRRVFKKQTGFPPWQYVLNLRLNRARRLLASSDAKLEDIAERVGFSSGFQLSLAFKRAYGESPASWRRTLADRDEGLE